MLYQNSSKEKEESALVKEGLSRAISRLSIKIIPFPGQNRKVLIGWRVYAT